MEFHPAWQLLMSGIVARGLHSRAWVQPVPGAQARAAAYLMQGQVEAGTLCPTTMTCGRALLQREPAGVIDYTGDWLPALSSREFDGADAPLSGKRGALIGMGLTEKQAVPTCARSPPAPRRWGRPAVVALINWWATNGSSQVPQADAHLVLAQTDEDSVAFRAALDSRRAAQCRAHPPLERQARQSQQRQRGSRVRGCLGAMVVKPAAAWRYFLEMAATTWLDCALGSAALLRQALVQSLHHAGHRHAFGKPLLAQPLDAQCAGLSGAGSRERPGAGAAGLARAVDERADLAARAGTYRHAGGAKLRRKARSWRWPNA